MQWANDNAKEIKAFGEEGRRVVERKYQPKEHVKKILEVYGGLIKSSE